MTDNNFEPHLNILVLSLFVFLLLGAYFREVITPFWARRNYIKNKLRHSQSRQEYKYWKKELLFARLRLIPFLRYFL